MFGARGSWRWLATASAPTRSQRRLGDEQTDHPTLADALSRPAWTACAAKTRPPGKAPLGVAMVNRVLEAVTETPLDATHWSLRTMAKAVGIAPSSVQAIWKAHGLKPHLATFEAANDPRAEKIDRRGRAVSQPAGARHRAVGRREVPVQALDRTQPGLPMQEGSGRNHDPRLQASRHRRSPCSRRSDVLDGRVIGQCMHKHRHQEFIRFLNRINREVAPDLDHADRRQRTPPTSTPRRRDWPVIPASTCISRRHRRPGSTCERFFAEITRKAHTSVFHSIVDLGHQSPRPAQRRPHALRIWTASEAPSSKRSTVGNRFTQLESQH